MPIVRSIVTIPAKSGIPEDAAMNTFHFNVDAVEVESTDFASIGAALARFYMADPDPGDATVNSLMSWMSNKSAGSTLPQVDHYIVGEGGVLGSPAGHSDFVAGWAPSSTGGFPAEVAACLSYHADTAGYPETIPVAPTGPAGDLHPKARRRGRLYFPFLTTDTGSADADGVRPATLFRYSLRGAGRELMNDAELAAAGIEWVVYSRKADYAYPVVGGYVDNAFDTQRRRGMKATNRAVAFGV